MGVTTGRRRAKFVKRDPIVHRKVVLGACYVQVANMALLMEHRAQTIVAYVRRVHTLFLGRLRVGLRHLDRMWTGVVQMIPPCQAGTYQEKSNQTVCVGAPPGKYATRGSAVALPCPPGKYSNKTKATSDEVCLACPKGKHSIMNGTVCIPCEPGSYGDEQGLSLCKRCDVGKAVHESESTQCFNCARGKYSSETGRAFCVDCSVGKMAKDSGQKICEKCGEGYTAGPGQTECVVDNAPCDPGFGLRGGDCVPCPLGEHSDVKTGKCAACSPGSYSDEEKEHGCTLCPAGRYGNLAECSQIQSRGSLLVL